MANVTNVKALEVAINTLATMDNMKEIVEQLNKIKTSYQKKDEYSEKRKTEKAAANANLREQIKGMLANNNIAIKAADIAEALDVEKGRVVYQLTDMASKGEVIKVPGENRKDPYSYKVA